jgi:hypothetical protein
MKPSYGALKYNTLCQGLKLRVMQLFPNLKRGEVVTIMANEIVT